MGVTARPVLPSVGGTAGEGYQSTCARAHRCQPVRVAEVDVVVRLLGWATCDRVDPVELIRRPDDLTESWLSSALGSGPVAAFDVAAVGTGQMSNSYRVSLTYDGDAAGPASVVVKLAAADETSRSTGVGLGAYEREVRFYRELAPRIGGPLPACHASAFDARD